MNYAEEIKQKINDNENENTVKAVIYARVSTDSDGQKDSCANQIELAMNFISNHTSIEHVGTYIDDGISGKNDFTRPQYNEMLSQISAGRIDLIITKSLSRLNRDEMNSFQLKQLLLQNNATVLTLEDNQVHDFEDINAELIHSISFAIDAQYVKRQSINGRKTHELRCKRKELSAKDVSYGYDWNRDNKSITINLEQAEIVKRIFEEYVYRNGTPASISRDLENEGIKISSRSLVNMLKDERYIGNFYINKRTTKLGTGKTKSKKIFLPKEQWILVERPDLQIIDSELFELAQRIRESRIHLYKAPDKKTLQARFQGTHKFSSKIFCPVCGKPYHFGYSDQKKTIPYYSIHSHGDCSNPIRRINEKDLEEITKITLSKVIKDQEELCDSLEQILLECVASTQNSDGEIKKLRKQVTTRENQINSLIDTLSEGGLVDLAQERIKTKINTITEDIERLNALIKSKEETRLDSSYVSNKIKDIKAAILDLKNFTTIDRDRVLNYIERIELPANGDINITLKSGQLITVKPNKNGNYTLINEVGENGILDDQYSSPEAYPVFPAPELPPQ
ncbi:MAG: recombinase family protein [Eubacterium sp.]|nr:recombinase family protein [Eubacterium sp.]